MKGVRGFEKIVAVKVMLAEFSDDTEAESIFLDEARLVSNIRTRNVAEVLDLGEQDNALFIVMEWVDGEQLNVVTREAKRQGGMPMPLIVRIIHQASAGLHVAHELADNEGKLLGLVHRDVSPQNILVGYDGTVKVIDFGVAKASSNQQRTRVGQLKGKIAYMAPEQAYGYTVDRRTDVFALGIVFYQLVTGKHPLRADNEFATLARIRDKRPVDRPSMHQPSIPEGIEQVILKAVAKEPDERFATMLEFSRALEEAFPTIDSSTEELASYMRSLLGPRGEKKRLAIREAIRAVDEDTPARNSVPPAFDPGRSFDLDDLRSSPGVSSRSEWLDRQTPRPPLDSSPGLRAREPSTPSSREVSGISAEGMPEDHLLTEPLIGIDINRVTPIPRFRRRPSAALIIVAVIAVAVVLGLALWGASSDSTQRGTPSGGEPARRPW
jgi:serine/threonine protein kinase